MAVDSPDGSFIKRPKSHFWMKAKNNLFKSQKFHRIIAKVPILSRVARREGEEIFRLMAGFIATQVLYVWVQTGALQKLSSKPHTVVMLSSLWEFDLERSEILCRAGEAVGLVKKKNGAYRLTRKGAVIIGLPGVAALIEHHKILYKDLQSPVDFFKGIEDTQLSKFWPYVFSGGMNLRSSEVEQYSNLMSESQYMVAADTLASVNIPSVCRWLDVGGGKGTFVDELNKSYPKVDAAVFDLPGSHSAKAKHTCIIGSFKEDELPKGYDIISLIRILYDHRDQTIENLLAKAHDALSKGGRLIVSEPMLGPDQPTLWGDVYFAMYTLAMSTGKTRSPEQISEFIKAAGFMDIKIHKATRPFITTVIEARRI